MPSLSLRFYLGRYYNDQQHLTTCSSVFCQGDLRFDDIIMDNLNRSVVADNSGQKPEYDIDIYMMVGSASDISKDWKAFYIERFYS